MATVKFTHLDAFKLKLGNVAGLASETLHETTPLLPKLGEVGAKIATKLDADLATMKSEMDKTPGSPLTEAIRQANKACDDTLNEIKRTTKVASQSTVTLKAEAGAVLMHFLEGFWHLDREPILTQIAMTRELLLRYAEAPVLEESAAVLGLAEMFSVLQPQNEELNRLYHERLEAQAQTTQSATSMRPVVVEEYNRLCTYILQLVHLFPDDADLLTLFHKLDIIRKKYAMIMPSPTDLHHATVETIPVQTYTGKAITPIPEARLGDTLLTFTKDFNVTYKNNVERGEATVILHGKGHYAGQTDRRFMIE